MNLDCVLRHDGRNWVAEGRELSVAAPTLEELDQRLAERLRSSGQLAPGKRLQVFMAFDNSTIPQWIRQYAQHYFNRIVTVTG